MKHPKGLIFAAMLLVLTVTLAACGDSAATTGPAAAPTTAASMTTAAMMTTASMTTAAMTSMPAMTTAAMTTPAAMTTAAMMTTAAPTTMAMTSMPAMTTAAGMTTAAMTTNASGTSATGGKTMEIAIMGFAFAPDTITIPVGTKVIWTNKDSVGHTVTSDDTGGPLKSSLIDQGKTFEYTFDKAGTYAYHCEPHPFMKAKIIVQ